MPRPNVMPSLPKLPARKRPAANDPLRRFTDGAVVKNTKKPVPLVATKIAVRIDGGLAVVTTERTFRNAEAESIEATVTFPVPVHAVLNHLAARIGDRTVVGTCQPKAAARASYEQAVDSGKTAVLHEEAIRGVHILSVGHVPAGKEITVIGTWAMPLAAAGEHAARLRIPTTVGDVYGRSPLSDPDDLVYDAAVRHEADLEVACDCGTAHLVGGGLVDGKARLLLDAPLDILVTGFAPRVLHGAAGDGRRVTLAIDPAPVGEAAIDADLAIDISGSMDERVDGNGEGARVTKYDAATSGLRQAASEAAPGDRIRLWVFNYSATRVSRPGEDLAAALARMPRTSGGTEIGGSLAQVAAASESRDVLVLTDGKSHSLDIRQLARTGKRFTVVLVGEDALEANIGHLAALTGGQLFVAGADVAQALRLAVASLRSPAGDLSPLRDKPEAVSACLGGMAIEARWTDGEAAADETSGAVGAFAAALALPRMPEDKAVDWAVSHGIVCHLTSLVLVDEAGEAQEGIPAQRKVALMAPRTGAAMQAANFGGAMPEIAAMSFCASPMRGLSKGLAPSGAMMMAKRRSAPASDTWSSTPGAMELLDLDECAADAPFDMGSGFPPAAAPDLRSVLGRVDWAADPNRLRQGDLSGLPGDVAAAVLAASAAQAVSDLAKELGIQAGALVVALLAKAEEGKDRNAARVARAVLGQADPAKVAAAMRAVGL